MKRAFGKTKRHLLQQPRLDAGRRHGRGDGRRPQPGLDGGAHRLVGGQFQLDAERGRVGAEIGQGFLENRSRARPRLAQHPFALHQVAEREVVAPPRMFGADDHDKLIARDGRTDEMLILDRSFDKAQFGDAAFDGGRDLCRVADRQADLDVWIGPPKSDEVTGKPVAGDRLTRMDGERSPVQRAEFAERELRRLGTRQHRPCLGEKSMAGFGQFDAAPHAIEEFRVVPRLQRGDRMTRGGLRHVQRASGLRHVLSFSDSDKDPQLIERHATLSFPSGG
jgi:hypothetical protein